ncbi:hypothetical protein F5Y15DRAFT_60267 [Xylariaceae sp. FL0016]|nr:hypothetical protein F5Y15DRAFT_60267 [Xylariaceae sp. FL0016]
MAPSQSETWFPNGGEPIEDGGTATCYCGAVSLAFSFKNDGVRGRFVCQCTDCRKVTASMFAFNLVAADDAVTWVRGRERLATFTKTGTIASGASMTNYFAPGAAR